MNIFKRLFGKKKLEQERIIPRPYSSFYASRTASTSTTYTDINSIIFTTSDYSNDSSSFDSGFGGGDFSGGGAGGSWDSDSSSYDSSNSSGDY